MQNKPYNPTWLFYKYVLNPTVELLNHKAIF